MYRAVHFLRTHCLNGMCQSGGNGGLKLAVNQSYLRSGRTAGGGKRHAHPSAGNIGNAAYGINRLKSRTGGNQNLFAV